MTSARPTGPAAGRWQPTVGVLVSSLFDPYQEAILAGAHRAATVLRARVVCYVGGALSAEGEAPSARERIFDLVRADSVDVLLVLGGSIGERVGGPAVARWLREVLAVPAVSIGLELPGMPSVLVDNAGGVRRLVEHLAVVHSCRRIGMIRGPSGNDEANARFAAYASTLERHGLPLDPALVSDGSWADESGVRAVATLLDERRAELDGLVAVDDNNALHAIEALRRRGVRVPRDVRVVGFDDIPDAQHATPGLTTVRQPLQKLGFVGMKLALQVLNGQEVAPVTRIPTHVILRESCGCSLETIYRGVVAALPRSGFGESILPPPAGAAPTSARPALSSSAPPASSMPPVASAPEPANAGPLAARLNQALSERHALDALSDELRTRLEAFLEQIEPAIDTGLRRPVLAELERILEESWATSSSTALWTEITTFALGLAARFLPAEFGEAVEGLWRECLFVIYRTEARQQAHLRARGERRGSKLQQVGDQLISALDAARVGELLREHLPTLGVRGSSLAKWTGGAPTAKALFDSAEYGDVGTAFPPRLLRPRGLTLQRASWAAVLPLVTEQRLEGFTVLEVDEVDGRFVELLASKTAIALRSSELVSTIQQHAVELERIVSERTRDLVELSHRLREQSLRDQLTGLHNRRYLTEVAAPWVQRLVEGKGRVALVTLDIDYFKQVNDVHGHGAGDRVLQDVGAILMASAGASGEAIRVGGEEFLVLAPDTDAVALAERIRTAVAEHRFELEGGESLRRTCSIGCMELPLECVAAPADLMLALGFADRALYAAKNGGRNRTMRVVVSGARPSRPSVTAEDCFEHGLVELAPVQTNE